MTRSRVHHVLTVRLIDTGMRSVWRGGDGYSVPHDRYRSGHEVSRERLRQLQRWQIRMRCTTERFPGEAITGAGCAQLLG
jgi:hypothetical protein